MLPAFLRNCRPLELAARPIKHSEMSNHRPSPKQRESKEMDVGDQSTYALEMWNGIHLTNPG